MTEGESRAGLGAHRVAREEKAQRVACTGWKWLSEDSAGEGGRGGHSAVMHSRHSTEMVRHGPLWVSTGEGHTHQQHHCKPKSGHKWHEQRAVLAEKIWEEEMGVLDPKDLRVLFRGGVGCVFFKTLRRVPSCSEASVTWISGLSLIT